MLKACAGPAINDLEGKSKHLAVVILTEFTIAEASASLVTLGSGEDQN